MSLKNYKALLYDCYGTLINWEQGMIDNAPVLKRAGAPSRAEFFARFGPHETRIQTETPTMPYPEVLKQGYLATAKDFGLEVSDEEASAFGNSVGAWPAFPDSADALERLNKMGLRQIILSNVNNASFEVSKKKLEQNFSFDAIYTAEKIGSYKPSLANFDYAISHIKSEFGIDAEDILIVANSKLHDIQPGHKKGLKGAWISRTTTEPVMGVSDYADVKPDWTFQAMKDFTDAMEEARK